jgi:hypothetical protein
VREEDEIRMSRNKPKERRITRK